MSLRIFRRKLVVYSFFTCVAFVVGIFSLSTLKSSQEVKFNVIQMPTLGNRASKVNIVVVEEPLCKQCSEFYLHCLGDIKKQYLNTGKAQLSIMMTSFLPNSSIYGECLLGIYAVTKEKFGAAVFFDALEYVYKNLSLIKGDKGKFSYENILGYIQELYGLSDKKVKSLKHSISLGAYKKALIKNTEYMRKMMNGKLAAPVVYINGKPLSGNSLSSVVRAIEENVEK